MFEALRFNFENQFCKNADFLNIKTSLQQLRKRPNADL